MAEAQGKLENKMVPIGTDLDKDGNRPGIGSKPRMEIARPGTPVQIADDSVHPETPAGEKVDDVHEVSTVVEKHVPVGHPGPEIENAGNSKKPA